MSSSRQGLPATRTATFPSLPAASGCSGRALIKVCVTGAPFPAETQKETKAVATRGSSYLGSPRPLCVNGVSYHVDFFAAPASLLAADAHSLTRDFYGASAFPLTNFISGGTTIAPETLGRGLLSEGVFSGTRGGDGLLRP